jgi:hypothetical protein
MATNDIAYPVTLLPSEPPTIVPGSVHFRHSSFETTVSYDRDTGHHVGLTFCHPLPRIPGDQPELVIGIYRTKDSQEPSSFVMLPLAEVRLLLALLQRHEVATYLDEEVEE